MNRPNLFRRDFLGHVVAVVSGTFAGQAALLLVTPLLTRLYSPEDFGAFALFSAFVAFASVALSGRLDMALPGAPTQRRADGLLALCLAMVLPTSLAGTAAYLALITGKVLGFGALPAWSALLMLPTLLATGAFVALRYWHVHAKTFDRIGSAVAQQGAGRALAPVLLGTVHSGFAGLAVGDLAGRLVGIGALLREARPRLARALRHWETRYALALARRHRRILTVLLPSSVVDAAAAAIAVPVFAATFGLKAAGEFALVVRIASAPSALVGAAVADVFQAHLATWLREDPARARRELARNAFRLAALGAALLGPAAALAPLLFAPVFGAEWTDGGWTFTLLTPALWIAFVVSPLSRALVVTDRLEWKLIVDAAFLLGPPLAVWACRDGSYFTALAAYSGAQFAVFCLYGWLVARAVASPQARG